MYGAVQGASACWTASTCPLTAATSSGVGANPPAASMYFAGIEARAPCSGRARPSSPSRCRSSITASCCCSPATSMNAASAVGRQLGEHHAVTDARHGLLGIHVHAAELRHGDDPDRVVHRAQRPQRSEQLVRLRGIAGVVGIDDHERGAPHLLRYLGDRREAQETRHGGQLVGERGLGQLPPGVHHLAGALDREPQQPRVGLREREQLELDRGHDAEAAATAAHGPEQIGLRSRSPRTSRPSAVTSSIAWTLFAARP